MSQIQDSAHTPLDMALLCLLDSDCLLNVDFDSYAALYPDVAESGHSPVLHYLKYGIFENRKVQLKDNSRCIDLLPSDAIYRSASYLPKYGNLYPDISEKSLKFKGASPEDRLYAILISPDKALLIPDSNFDLFTNRNAEGKLWSLLPSGDLAFAHLVSYRPSENGILIKPAGTKHFLSMGKHGLEEKADGLNPAVFELIYADKKLPDRELHEALFANLLAGRFGNISLTRFNKIIIDLILQMLPFAKWDPASLGISNSTIRELKALYPESPLLGEMHSLSGNRMDLPPDFDWLAQYYGYAGGRSWGSAHSIHHLWRRTFRPTKRCCLLTSARNEGPYLLEFVAFYKALGIDGIFIYSNDNDDGSEELLEALARRGEIFYISNYQGNVGAQAKSFAHALSLNREILNYEWCLLTDIDEFLWLNPDEFNDLEEFLAYHEGLSSKNIFINWTYVGANGNVNYGPGEIISRFPFSHSKPEKTGKNIFKPRYAYAAYCHHPHVIKPSGIPRTHASGAILNMDPSINTIDQYAKSDIMDISSATTYHYFTKSFDEFMIKCSRNAGGRKKIDGVDFSRMTVDYFGGFLYHFNAKSKRTDFTDSFLNRYLNKLYELLQDPEILEASAHIRRKFQSQLQNVRGLFREHLKKDDALAERFNAFISKWQPDYFKSEVGDF